MAENDYKEIDENERAASGSSEERSLSFTDIIKPTDSASTLPGHSAHESGSIGHAAGSLPELSISGEKPHAHGSAEHSGSGSVSDLPTGEKPKPNGPTDGDGVSGLLRNLIGGGRGGAGDSNSLPIEVREMRIIGTGGGAGGDGRGGSAGQSGGGGGGGRGDSGSGGGGGGPENGVLRTLTDLIGNGADRVQNTLRDKLNGQADRSYGEVAKALKGLPEGLQNEYNKLEGAKAGFSQEQLAFIKKHAGMDAYNSAQNYNDVTQTIRALDAIRGGKKDVGGIKQNAEGAAEGQAPRERKVDHAQDAKDAYREVKAHLAQLPEKLQNAFAKLPDAKGGNYSNEQLAFLKQHAGPKAYDAANRFNEANNGQRQDRMNQQNAEGAAEGQAPRERKVDHAQDAKDAYREVKAHLAQLPEKLQNAFAKLPDSKSGNYSNEQLAFLKQHAGPKAYDAANRFNEANNAQRQERINQPQERQLQPANEQRQAQPADGQGQTPAERAADAAREAQPLDGQRETKTDKRMAFIKDEVAKLPKELQAKFANLPMFKDGVGFNEAHVNFLAKNVSKEAAQQMQTYIAERHQQLWGGKKK